MLEFFLIKLQEQTLDLNNNNLNEKNLQQRGFPVNKLEFSTPLEKGLTWALFFDKIGSCVLFSQNIFFKAGSIQYIFQKASKFSLHKSCNLYTVGL